MQFATRRTKNLLKKFAACFFGWQIILNIMNGARTSVYFALIKKVDEHNAL
jgi:hypothetical protein